jgi:hypothetical protein
MSDALTPERRKQLGAIATEVTAQEVTQDCSRVLSRPTLRAIILDALLRAESSQAQPTCATCRHGVVWWSNRNYLACQHQRCPVQVLTHDRAAEWGCVWHEPAVTPLPSSDHAQDGDAS